MFSCIDDDGSLNDELYLGYKRHRRDEQEKEEQAIYQAVLDDILSAGHNFDDVVEEPPPTKKKRNPQCVLEHVDEAGNRKACPPKESTWYKQYLVFGEKTVISNTSLKKFRLRFRLPYDQYWKLLHLVESNYAYFERHLKRTSKPIELLLLGTLRYLGRGFTFDDLEELTAIGKETHRKFFHAFIAFGRTILFDKYVCQPTLAEIMRLHATEFNMAGCNGAMGSSDGVHVMCEKIPAALRNVHIGHKMGFTARSYNVTANHRRFILSTTCGHPATYNDKTLVLFDPFIRGIYDGSLYSDMEFKLWEKDEDGNEVEQCYKGCWVIVDNGYHQWSTTIPPVKVSGDRRVIRWSEWIESMRKDVEW